MAISFIKKGGLFSLFQKNIISANISQLNQIAVLLQTIAYVLTSYIFYISLIHPHYNNAKMYHKTLNLHFQIKSHLNKQKHENKIYKHKI